MTPGNSHQRIRRAPRAEERQELGDEARRRRQPERRQAGDGERRRDAGHHRAEAAHLEDLARVRLLVDEADEREEQAGHDPVREHLEHRAVEAVLGQRRRAEHHDAHVRDGRVGDDVLQVGLRHRAQRAVDDVDAGDRADEPRPLDRARPAAGPCRGARRRRRRASSARRRGASTPRSAPRRGRRATRCAAARCRRGCRSRCRTRGTPTSAASGRTAPARRSRNENDCEPAAT